MQAPLLVAAEKTGFEAEKTEVYACQKEICILS